MVRGSRMLQVTGIIMIVFGAIDLVMTLTGAAGIIALFGLAGAAGFGAVLALIGLFSSLVGGVIELVAGILGAKNWAEPAKAQGCITMAIIIIALNVISFIGDISGGDVGSSLFGLVIGLVLPGLYLIGALALKKQA